jgi:filamentous hemagglutinin family protein
MQPRTNSYDKPRPQLHPQLRPHLHPQWRPRLRVLAAAVLGTLTGTALALPNGNQTVAGQGSVAVSGSTMTVTQQSVNLSINWNGFSIGNGETVRFVQPSSSSVALNRVTGSDPSAIYGNLSANGQVFLVNPNGVLFGPSARVDVGGLVASTLDISDSDLAGRKFKFGSGNAGQSGPPAAVLNQGKLTASPGGYIALLGGSVSNQGTISARLGTAALAAGGAITLDFSGDKLLNVKVDAGAYNALAENRQLINADGGTVIMTAGARDALLSTVVNNSGVIEARTVENRGGVITLLGTDANGHLTGTVKVGGTLDVSAPADPNPAGGGTELRAGFVETSGANVEIIAGAQVKAGAAQGRAGTWLIDPTDILINAAAAGTIAGTLNGGGNVTQNTSSGGTDAGNITVAAPITWSGTGTLSLIADHDIAINAAINGANGGLTLSAANSISAPAAVNVGTFTLSSGNWSQVGASLPAFSAANFRIAGGSFLRALGGDGSSGNPYLLADVYGLQGMGSSALLAQSFALANDINAAGTANWNSGDGFAPIGDSSTAYTGSFNGNSHTVSNLTINRPSQDYVGLFGYIGAGGAASNLALAGGSVHGLSQLGMLAGQSDGSVTGVTTAGVVTSGIYDPVNGGFTGSNIGGVVGYNTGTVSNSTSSAAVNNGFNVGGLVGSNDGTVINTSANGAVNGFDSAGGLVGQNAGSISASYAAGTVDGGGAGGLVGANYGSVSNAHASGAVHGGTGSGGLAGYNMGTLTDVYATGAVSGSSWAGGLVGYNSGPITRAYATGDVTGTSGVGGLIGSNNAGGIVSLAWAGGSVSGSNWYAGGMVGYNTDGTFTDSYATGRVRGLDYAGGFFGYTDSGSFTRDYASGSVATTGGPTAPHVGGFGGQAFGGAFTNNFWDRASTGQNRASPIGSQATGLTATQAMTQSSYTNFNFTSTWVIYAGQTRPMLRAFLTPLTVSAANATKTYDATSYSGGNGYTLPAGADAAKILGTAAYTGTSQGARNVGSYAITMGGLYSTQLGYLLSYAPGTLTINPATLTYTAALSTQGAGQMPAGLTGVVSGFVGSDTLLNATSGAALWSTPATGASPAGIYAITGGGLAANHGNYVFAQAAGNATALTLTPAPAAPAGSSGSAGSGSGTGSAGASLPGSTQDAVDQAVASTYQAQARIEPGQPQAFIADNVFSAPPPPCTEEGAGAAHAASAGAGASPGQVASGTLASGPSASPAGRAGCQPRHQAGGQRGPLLRVVDSGLRLPAGIDEGIGGE